jgi:hypothetical protein
MQRGRGGCLPYSRPRVKGLKHETKQVDPVQNMCIPLATEWTVHIPAAWGVREQYMPTNKPGRMLGHGGYLFSAPVTLVVQEALGPHLLRSPRWSINVPFASPLCDFLQKTFPRARTVGSQLEEATPFWSDWQCKDGSIRLLQCRVVTYILSEPVAFVLSFDGALTLTD